MDTNQRNASGGMVSSLFLKKLDDNAPVGGTATGGAVVANRALGAMPDNGDRMVCSDGILDGLFNGLGPELRESGVEPFISGCVRMSLNGDRTPCCRLDCREFAGSQGREEIPVNRKEHGNLAGGLDRGTDLFGRDKDLVALEYARPGIGR